MVSHKEIEKVNKYQDLVIEIQLEDVFFRKLFSWRLLLLVVLDAEHLSLIRFLNLIVYQISVHACILNSVGIK